MTVPPSSEDALDVTGLDPNDDQLLRAMRSAAAGVQPDPAFRHRLWADLAAQPAARPPAPVAFESPQPRNEKIPMRPSPRMAATNRRWTSPIATLAAALVIALVGYGALSLSGATPTGINLGLDDVPNASAEGQTTGQGLAEHPVVGTWGVLDDLSGGTSTSLPLLLMMTLDAGGGVTATSIGDWTGQGTWTADGESITVEFSVLVTQAALERQMPNYELMPEDDQPRFVPHISLWRFSFILSEDYNGWDNIELDLEAGIQTTSFQIGSNNPQFFIVEDFYTGGETVEDEPIVRRLDDIVRSAPTITSEDAGFESSDPLASPAANTTLTEPTPTISVPTQQSPVRQTVTPIATVAPATSTLPPLPTATSAP